MRFRNVVAAAVVIAAGAAVGAAQAAPVYVETVEAFAPGSGTRTPDGAGDPLASVQGAPDGVFLSLGIGGKIVLGFGNSGPFTGSSVFFERTNDCVNATDCGHWPESVAVYSSMTQAGLSDDNTGWSFAGALSNGVAPGEQPLPNTRGYVLDILETFNYLLLVDTSPTGGSPNTTRTNAGWDVDAVSVAPIPVPAALPLLLAGIGGLAWAGRRRNPAA